MMATLKCAKLHCFRAGEPAKFPGSPLGGSVLLRSSARALISSNPVLDSFARKSKSRFRAASQSWPKRLPISEVLAFAARNSFRVADNSPRTSSFASHYPVSRKGHEVLGGTHDMMLAALALRSHPWSSLFEAQKVHHSAKVAGESFCGCL